MNPAAVLAPRCAPCPAASEGKPDRQVACLMEAAHALAALLAERGVLDIQAVRSALSNAFGASDAAGAWSWKLAGDAGEAALVLFLRRHGAAMRAQAPRPEQQLAMLERLARGLPVQSRRSEESQALQQFSTPLPLGFVASLTADLRPDDRVLEPSAGTGLLAVFAEQAGASLILNELSDARAGLLTQLFAPCPVSRHDAAALHDRLAADQVPSVVLMNPPFSAAPGVCGRVADAAWRHLDAALARLAPGGRLVAITGQGLSPDEPKAAKRLRRLQHERAARVVFTVGLDRGLFARHGTRVATRLTVIDRVATSEPDTLVACAGQVSTASALLTLVRRGVPPRSGRPRLVALPMLAAPAAERVHSPSDRRAAPSVDALSLIHI